VKLDWVPDPIFEELMKEKTLLDAGWTPEAIENMEPHMAQARYMAYSFLDEISAKKGNLI